MSRAPPGASSSACWKMNRNSPPRRSARVVRARRRAASRCARRARRRASCRGARRRTPRRCPHGSGARRCRRAARPGPAGRCAAAPPRSSSGARPRGPNSLSRLRDPRRGLVLFKADLGIAVQMAPPEGDHILFDPHGREITHPGALGSPLLMQKLRFVLFLTIALVTAGAGVAMAGGGDGDRGKAPGEGQAGLLPRWSMARARGSARSCWYQWRGKGDRRRAREGPDARVPRLPHPCRRQVRGLRRSPPPAGTSRPAGRTTTRTPATCRRCWSTPTARPPRRSRPTASRSPQLRDADGSAVIVDVGPDNYANIPPRYGTPDQDDARHRRLRRSRVLRRHPLRKLAAR